jgi:hypothetical protein
LSEPNICDILMGREDFLQNSGASGLKTHFFIYPYNNA